MRKSEFQEAKAIGLNKDEAAFFARAESPPADPGI
jgi:hypothetical protein